jgi:hypothetical protein
MSSGDFESGRTVPVLIPEPVWQEWKMNGVGPDSLAELQSEHGAAVGYEFDWGQIIEEVSDGYPETDSEDQQDLPGLALCWHFVLSGVYGEFLRGGGNLGELSDLATAFLAEAEQSRDELPQAMRDDALPAGISFDEGNNISAFAVCVLGQSNVSVARQWMSSYFIPAVLPLVIDRLREESDEASHIR